MEIEAFIPQNDLLKKHIECYYFINRSKSDKTFKYYTFPSNNTIVSLTNGEIESNTDGKVIINALSDSGFNCELTKPFFQPLEVEYSSEVSEITIYFKPLSIYNFLKSANHKFIFQDQCVLLREKTFLETFNKLLHERNSKVKSKCIEAYLLNIYEFLRGPVPASCRTHFLPIVFSRVLTSLSCVSKVYVNNILISDSSLLVFSVLFIILYLIISLRSWW